MRDQYAGDISDFLKYALLRALAADDYKLGIAWYFNQNHDGRPDGRHTEYAQWRLIDEPLWNELDGFCKAFHSCNDVRTVKNLEKLNFWPPDTVFHGTGDGEAVPRFKKHRQNWIHGVREKLDGSRLVFLDPDNSVHSTITARHASYSDICSLRVRGRAIICIKFPAHVNFEIQLRDFHDKLKRLGGAESVITLRSQTAIHLESGGKVARPRWFSLINFDNELEKRFACFAERINGLNGVSAGVSRG